MSTKNVLENTNMIIEFELTESGEIASDSIIDDVMDAFEGLIKNENGNVLLEIISEMDHMHIIHVKGDNSERMYGIMIQDKAFVAENFEYIYENMNTQLLYVDMESGLLKAYNYITDDDVEINDVLESTILILPRRIRDDNPMTVTNDLGHISISRVNGEFIKSVCESLSVFKPTLNKALIDKTFIITSDVDVVWSVSFDKHGIINGFASSLGLDIIVESEYKDSNVYWYTIKIPGLLHVFCERNKHAFIIREYSGDTLTSMMEQIYNVEEKLVKTTINGTVTYRADYHPNGNIKTKYENTSGAYAIAQVFSEDGLSLEIYRCENEPDAELVDLVYSIKEVKN